MRLLKLPHVDPLNEEASDLSLGYVNHVWNPNSYYQVVGNLFIGVAPVFGCTATSLGLMSLLAPKPYNAVLTLAEVPSKVNLLSSLNTLLMSIGWWQPLLLLLLTINTLLLVDLI